MPMNGQPPRIDSDGTSPTAGSEGRPRGFVSGGTGATWFEDLLSQFQDAGAELPPELLEEQRAVSLQWGDVVVDRFEVIELLGFGGMGAVYHVKDRHLHGEEKALKVMLPSLLGSEMAKERFLSEVSISQKLRHEAIVTVFDLGEDKPRGVQFFTMEYVPGMTLHRLLKERGGRLPLNEARDIARQVCDALEYAHQYTIHRDLKPQNIMVRPDGRIKILDFGLAKLMSPGRLTKSSMALGTAYYQAPEQSVHLRELDHRADIYSLGVILYQMLTGRIPLGMAKAPSELVPSLPKGVDAVATRRLQPEPGDRYASAATLRGALDTCGKRKLRGWFWPAAAAVAVVAVILGVILSTSGRQPAPIGVPPQPAGQKESQREAEVRPVPIPTPVPAPKPDLAAEVVAAKEKAEAARREAQTDDVARYAAEERARADALLREAESSGTDYATAKRKYEEGSAKYGDTMIRASERKEAAKAAAEDMRGAAETTKKKLGSDERQYAGQEIAAGDKAFAEAGKAEPDYAKAKSLYREADTKYTEAARVTPKRKQTVPAKEAPTQAAPAGSEAKPVTEEPKEEPLPEVLAKVGDDTITSKDFERKLRVAKGMSKAEGAMGSPTIEQKRQLLQNMIREKAVLTLAKSQGITVSEEEVQNEVDNAKSKFSREQFKKRMADQGITEGELPNLVRQSLVIRKFADSRTKDLQATDEELAAEFERMKSTGKADRKDETTDVAHILIRVEEGADEAAWNAAKEKIDAARRRITGGQKFEDMAKEVSEDPGSKEKGGLYTEVRKGMMVPEFEEKMLSMPVGQVSEPFKSKYGWHILTVVAKHAPGSMTLDEVKPKLSEDIIGRKRSQVVTKLMQEAEAGVKTEILYAPFAEPSAPPPAPPASEGGERK